MLYKRARKHATHRKKKLATRRTRRTTRRTRTPRLVDPTVQKLNPGRDKVIKVYKSLTFNAQNYPQSSSGVSGFQIQSSTTTSYNWGTTVIFDPTGTFGNNSGLVTTNTSTLAGCALSQWTAYKALYSHYKVTKIHLRFRADDNGASGLTSISPVLYMRYNNEYLAPSANQVTSAFLSSEKNVIRKTFTPEHPDYTYSFKPVVMQLVDNAGILTTESRVAKRMPWTNVNTPVELYGMQFYIYMPAQTNVTILSCDISYEILFKEQS